jgi:TPP-dependent indolepyruvate ferredoxin oxidoreductase alpha subunit|tara:strand:+ start:9219 stop:9560 length:342 start_codon:yes stop_codon:yes gene_type:complete
VDIFPVRKEVDWEELDSEKIVIVVNKDLSSIEEKIANFLGAPRTIRRPLDEMNSKLWLLMDGKMNVEQIVSEMDRVFHEKIAPANERVNRSIADFVNLGLVELMINGSDIESE